MAAIAIFASSAAALSAIAIAAPIKWPKSSGPLAIAVIFLTAATLGSGLYIAFGHFSGNDAKGVKIGQLLRAALEREGFNVEWDGTIGRRLFVKGFRWQRRGP